MAEKTEDPILESSTNDPLDVERQPRSWPWLKRPYNAGDEDIVVSLWVKKHARNHDAGRYRARDRDGFWRQHADIAAALVGKSTTLVLCDARENRIVWSFACYSPGIVHFAAVKPRYAEFKTEMLADLLGEQYTAPLRYSYVMPDLLPMPASWVYDPYCIQDILQQPSQRRAAFLETADAFQRAAPAQAIDRNGLPHEGPISRR